LNIEYLKGKDNVVSRVAPQATPKKEKTRKNSSLFTCSQRKSLPILQELEISCDCSTSDSLMQVVVNGWPELKKIATHFL